MRRKPFLGTGAWVGLHSPLPAFSDLTAEEIGEALKVTEYSGLERGRMAA